MLVNTKTTENSLGKVEFEGFRNNMKKNPKKPTTVISVHSIKELVNLKSD